MARTWPWVPSGNICQVLQKGQRHNPGPAASLLPFTQRPTQSLLQVTTALPITVPATGFPQHLSNHRTWAMVPQLLIPNYSDPMDLRALSFGFTYPQKAWVAFAKIHCFMKLHQTTINIWRYLTCRRCFFILFPFCVQARAS